MTAVHLQDGSVMVRRTPRPKRPPGHALIHFLRGGICNTDIELLNGYYAFRGTPGHEFVGVVAESDDQRWVGKTVVAEINLACGKCEWCLERMGRHCPSRSVLGIVKQPGAFREYLTLPVANLHSVPPEVQLEHAVFTEPLAAACEILDQIRIPKGATAAVLAGLYHAESEKAGNRRRIRNMAEGSVYTTTIKRSRGARQGLAPSRS